MTILNIVSCVPRETETETAKYNTHDKRNIIMTDDLHVPVTNGRKMVCRILIPITSMFELYTAVIPLLATNVISARYSFFNQFIVFISLLIFLTG